MTKIPRRLALPISKFNISEGEYVVKRREVTGTSSYADSHFDLTNPVYVDLEILDELGRVQIQKRLMNQAREIEIPLNDLVEGACFCRVTMSDGTHTAKFIIRR